MAEPHASEDQPTTFSPQERASDATASPPAGDQHLHELRVRIPEDLHRQLLSLKILRGKSLAQTVSSALDDYFAEHAPAASESAAGRVTP